jgi:hypothetical protein
MDQFADRLARIGELSEDEVAQLEAELVAAFDAADSAGDVDLMQQLSDALDAVRAAKTVTPEAAVPEAAPVAAAAETPVVAEDQTPAAEPPVVPAQQVATEQQPQPQPEGARRRGPGPAAGAGRADRSPPARRHH